MSTMRAHIVQQGDHLDGLAARHGFDAQEVWQHDANRELREERSDPQVLAPGDVLFMPEPETGGSALLEPNTTNRYEVHVQRLEVEVQLLAGPNRPMANEPFVVRGLARSFEGTTDDQGLATFPVSATQREVTLELTRSGASMNVLVGSLDPVTRRNGLRSRLVSLGFLTDPAVMDTRPTASPDVIDEGLAIALRAMQSARGITESGEVDAATAEALEADGGA